MTFSEYLRVLLQPNRATKPQRSVAYRTEPTRLITWNAKRTIGHLAGRRAVRAGLRAARLIAAGEERLAGRIEHISQKQGDGAGFDILSFDETGAERLIEVKTTKYGRETPFFVSRNEVAVSESRATNYRLYRLFGFCEEPRMFTLAGALSATCRLSAESYLATVQ